MTKLLRLLGRRNGRLKDSNEYGRAVNVQINGDKGKEKEVQVKVEVQPPPKVIDPEQVQQNIEEKK